MLAQPLYAQGRDDELILGIAPFMSPEALFKRMTPLQEYLSEKLDRKVVIELNRSVEQLIERTDADRFDLVYTGPSFALRAFGSGLYSPAVIPDELSYSIFLVNRDSPVNSLNDLKGKLVSTPPAKGAVARIGPVFFEEQGFSSTEIPKFKPYASHNAAFLAMRNGDTDAAMIASFAYRDGNGVGSDVRVIAKTESYPGISLILSNRLSAALREEIIVSMVELGNSDTGRKVLDKINFKPFRRISIQEFNHARRYLTNEPQPIAE